MPSSFSLHPSHSSSLLPHSFPSLFFSTSSLSNQFNFVNTKASVSESHNETSDDTTASLLDQQFILCVIANAKDANEALQMIAGNSSQNDGVVSTFDYCSIITAAINHHFSSSLSKLSQTCSNHTPFPFFYRINIPQATGFNFRLLSLFVSSTRFHFRNHTDYISDANRILFPRPHRLRFRR